MFGVSILYNSFHCKEVTEKHFVHLYYKCASMSPMWHLHLHSHQKTTYQILYCVNKYIHNSNTVHHYWPYSAIKAMLIINSTHQESCGGMCVTFYQRYSIGTSILEKLHISVTVPQVSLLCSTQR